MQEFSIMTALFPVLFLTLFGLGTYLYSDRISTAIMNKVTDANGTREVIDVIVSSAFDSLGDSLVDRINGGAQPNQPDNPPTEAPVVNEPGGNPDYPDQCGDYVDDPNDPDALVWVEKPC